MKNFIFEVSTNFPKNIRKDIESLITALPYTPIWQTIEWQVMLQETGYSAGSFFVGIYEEKKLQSYVLLEKRSVGLRQHAFFGIGGPVWSDETSLNTLSQAIRELARKEGVVFVQCEPLRASDIPDFTTGHYKDFIEKHTALIDLRQDEEAILARMKQKGRYNIRVAEKAGITVESVAYSEEHLDAFYSLLTETTDRDAFAVNSRAYFATFLRYLEKYKLGGLVFARKEALTPNPSPKGERGETQNEVIAAGIFVFFGKTAFYYYGASSSDNAKRKYMASYLLQWEMIRAARERGCTTFDFLGIADPSDPHSHLAGVTDFKMKLTDEVREWPASQIRVVRWGWWWVMRGVRGIKRMMGR